MNFGQALELLKEGKSVKRKAWGGFWFIDKFYTPNRNPNDATRLYMHKPMIFAFLADGSMVPAQPYQADMLAEDWEEVKA